MILAIVISIGLTAFCHDPVLNLRAGEKQIRYRSIIGSRWKILNSSAP